jgi:hypothetical protein
VPLILPAGEDAISLYAYMEGSDDSDVGIVLVELDDDYRGEWWNPCRDLGRIALSIDRARQVSQICLLVRRAIPGAGCDCRAVAGRTNVTGTDPANELVPANRGD